MGLGNAGTNPTKAVTGYIHNTAGLQTGDLGVMGWGFWVEKCFYRKCCGRNWRRRFTARGGVIEERGGNIKSSLRFCFGGHTVQRIPFLSQDT